MSTKIREADVALGLRPIPHDPSLYGKVSPQPVPVPDFGTHFYGGISGGDTLNRFPQNGPALPVKVVNPDVPTSIISLALDPSYGGGNQLPIEKIDVIPQSVSGSFHPSPTQARPSANRRAVPPGPQVGPRIPGQGAPGHPNPSGPAFKSRGY